LNLNLHSCAESLITAMKTFESFKPHQNELPPAEPPPDEPRPEPPPAQIEDTSKPFALRRISQSYKTAKPRLACTYPRDSDELLSHTQESKQAKTEYRIWNLNSLDETLKTRLACTYPRELQLKTRPIVRLTNNRQHSRRIKDSSSQTGTGLIERIPIQRIPSPARQNE